jgi:heat shock protein HslJ
VTGAAPGDLVGNRWRLRAIGGETVPAGVEVVLQVDTDHVSGNSGCNTYGAPLTLGDDTLSLGPVAATEMACDEPRNSIENQFLQALTAGTEWVVTDTTLEMRNADGATLAFDRMPADFPGTPAPDGTSVATPNANITVPPQPDGQAIVVSGTPAANLIGSTWSLVGLPGVANVTNAGAMIELSQDFYGGSSGCNRFVGPLTVTQTGLSLSPATWSLSPCTEAQAIIEGSFAQALEQAVEWRVNGDQLEFVDAGGQVLATFERQ